MSATALVSVVAQLRDVRNMRTGRWVRIVRAESAIADDVDLDGLKWQMTEEQR